MHISSCLNPRSIKNPYTGERQMVACGKCSACLNAKASNWVQRLDQERYCWKYCLFFTLTYSPEHVPTVVHNNVFCQPVDFRHLGKDSCLPVIDIGSLHTSLFGKDLRKSRKFFDTYDKFYYLSKYDVQCFVKRLRINLCRIFKSERNILNEKDYKIRYFICGEYGPKGKPYRPHYHGLLFFNSSFTASVIQEMLSKTWKFGFVNSSFVEKTNSNYVAQYLNCSSHLPKVYEHKSIRPFILFSKNPPIGTLAHSSQEIRKIFFSATPSLCLHNHKQGLFENVHLWQTYQRRLYPRLSGFAELNHSDRVTLYRVFEKCDRAEFESSSAWFCKYLQDWLVNPDCNALRFSTVVRDYADFLYRRTGNVNPFIRWFNVSVLVCEQARSFDIPVREYVRIIEEFYSNCDKFNISSQMDFEVDYADKYGPQSLIGLDVLFLKSLFDIPKELLSYEELEILSSYHIDFDKFFSDDSGVRSVYYQTLIPYNTFDFLCFKIDSEVIRRNNCKTKDKNETINENIFGDF